MFNRKLKKRIEILEQDIETLKNERYAISLSQPPAMEKRIFENLGYQILSKWDERYKDKIADAQIIFEDATTIVLLK